MTARIPQPPKHIHGLLTLAEVAAYVGRSERTVWRWIRSGRLPGIQLGGRWFVEERALANATDGQGCANQDHEP